MIRRLALPLLAIAGVIAAVAMVMHDERAQPLAAVALPSPKVPFASYVAGTGLTEASTGNIAIGTPVSGIVSAVDVRWGEKVAAGAPLFSIDDRDVEANLLVAEAKAKESAENLAKTNNLLRIAQKLDVGKSISAEDLANRRFDAQIQAAALAAANAQVQQLKIEVARRTIRAPTAGRVLQISTRVGEFAQSGVVSPPLMLFGDDSRLYLRVNIDEDDAWRVRADAPAVAFVRGNPALKTNLTFVRFEPYVVPKASFTGSSTERTDVRVLQVIYSFDHAALPVYVGQMMDAFIKAPPPEGASGGTRAQIAKSP